MIDSIDSFLLGFVLGPIFMVFLEILNDLFKNFSFQTTFFYKKNEALLPPEDNKIYLTTLEKKLKKCIECEDHLFVSASQKYATMDQINQKSEKRKSIENELNTFFKKIVGMKVYDAYKFAEAYNYLLYVKYEKISSLHICDEQCNSIFNTYDKIPSKNGGIIKKINVKA